MEKQTEEQVEALKHIVHSVLNIDMEAYRKLWDIIDEEIAKEKQG